MTSQAIDMSRVTMLFEIRGLYDGWSVAELDDGTLVNRWSDDDPRHNEAQKFIDRIEDQRD